MKLDNSLFSRAFDTILENNINNKIQLTNHHYLLFNQDQLSLDKTISIKKITIPGRPHKPKLVLPKDLSKRKLSSVEGKAALLHAICHIEFNAINLAWDAVYRFQDMPKEYYTDWTQIAYEEAKHFKLLREYLIDLGYDYGSFVAHNGLWEMAVATDYDILARMALVPRVLEARGLDVTPGIINKFKSIGDTRAVEILNLILEEEKGHVAAGNKWFHYLCKLRNLNSLFIFKELISKYAKNHIKLPISRLHRLASGFSKQELDFLESL